MKVSVIYALLGSGVVTTANIIFPYVQPTCSHNEDTCLRGQICLHNGTCIAEPAFVDHSLSPRQAAPRPDGRCGKDFSDATCDPEGAYGACCSEYGYCGTTADHCLVTNGCQSGCASDASSAAASTMATTHAISSAETQVTNAAVSNSEPIIGPATSTNAGAAGTGAPTTNGMCGVSNGNTVCGNWSQGSCCSMYGFCGNSTAHCGSGCQSGSCDQPVVPTAPGPSPAPANAEPGSFRVVGQSGVPAMHAALLPNGRVVFLDKVENYTQLQLPNGYYAYSAEYDPQTNKIVPLAYKTNAFCAGGSFLPNGTLVSVGGNGLLTWLDPTVGNGFQGIRYLTRSTTNFTLDGDNWVEPGNQLNTARWYPSVQTMPDGTLFVASGSLNGLDPTVDTNNNPTYEILSAEGVAHGTSTTWPFLVKAQPYYMYPFLHLLNDGTLFAQVSKSAEVFDVTHGQVVKTLDDLPGDYRTYPNTGSSVLLPLSSGNRWAPEVIICGGGAYQDITSPTDTSCGRTLPMATKAEWEMDSMPEGRGMVEGTLLPDGTVLWVNGANKGAQGFNLATDPTFEVLIYDPNLPLGERWSTGASTNIPRLYHSVALLLLDGTLMIAGSNPDQMPVISPDTDPQGFQTEFRVEIYTPPYLSGTKADRRPTNIILSTTNFEVNSGIFNIQFTAPLNAQSVKVALYHGGFVTHAVHMSARILFLDSTGWQAGFDQQRLEVTMPPSSNVAPPGPYVVYVVVDGTPGVGQFVMVS